jgi:2-C-methyl-D-erythritol 4-phosphate cytidylyltransferase
VSGTWAVVVAAGAGTRFGSPKQFELLAGARLVDRSVTVAASACEHVVVVLPPDTTWDGPPVTAVVSGGRARSDSVRAGLDVVARDADIVVVHDAVRALASRQLFDAVIDAVHEGADGAVPVIPIPDTLKRVNGASVVATVPRDDLVSAQTPQAFRSAVLRTAHASRADASDDAVLVEACGGRIVTVPGDPANIKITTPQDLRLAGALLATRQETP